MKAFNPSAEICKTGLTELLNLQVEKQQIIQPVNPRSLEPNKCLRSFRLIIIANELQSLKNTVKYKRMLTIIQHLNITLLRFANSLSNYTHSRFNDLIYHKIQILSIFLKSFTLKRGGKVLVGVDILPNKTILSTGPGSLACKMFDWNCVQR